MVNFRENELKSAMVPEIKPEIPITPQKIDDNAVKIDIKAEDAKKLISSYNFLIKRELVKMGDILFNINAAILELDQTKEDFDKSKLQISKLLVNLMASLSSVEVVYTDDNGTKQQSEQQSSDN